MELVITLLQIAFGGALGAVSRFLFATGVMRATGGGLPLGILSVNVLGSFLMGVAVTVFTHHLEDVRLAPFVMTGFLGGFTTFSAFSLDTVNLIENGRFATAAFYVTGSVGLSVLALVLGMAAAKGI
jgi:CrcB protein